MSKICLALDGLSLRDALALVEQLGKYCFAVKIHDLLDAEGPEAISSLIRAGARRVWIDYKVHDTKDTVGLRVKSLIANGAHIVTVHASGGVEMMQAAMAAANGQAQIWAITVLTSLSPADVERIYGCNRDGTPRTPAQVALDFAMMAEKAKVDGVVCSAQEVGMLSRNPDLGCLNFTVPGTRSAGADLGQQKRSGTPAQAIDDGATFLVAGSQVTKAKDPVAAFKAMAGEIGTPIE
jgi:orotidine-5'-phosphate decarboxylase